MMQKDRDPSFDAFRGIAIIAAVAIHAAYMGFSIRNTPKEEWNFPFLVAYCQLLNFCIPVFFFISGYFVSTKLIESWKDYWIFITRRLSRILVPYFFWSVILLGYAAIRENKFDVYQIIFKLIAGKAAFPYYPYYFILVLAQLYVLTPLLHYLNSRQYGATLIILVNVIGLLGLYLSRMGIIWRFPITLSVRLWIVFYEMGLLIGNPADNLFSFRKLRFLILPCLLVSVIIMELEGYVIISKFHDVFFAVSITRYSSFLYSMFVIFGFLALREHISRWPGFLIILGKCSFGIYLIHMSVLNKVFEYTRTIDAVYSFQPLYQLIVLSVTILICFVFISVARKLLSGPFCEKILGF